jgi:hypothetical protein
LWRRELPKTGSGLLPVRNSRELIAAGLNLITSDRRKICRINNAISALERR